MIVRRIGLAVAGAIAFASSASAIDLEKMQTANGIAAIVSNAESCGFKVNEDALADYYVKSGLATPEGLAYVDGMISIKKISEKPTVSQCTIARVTAKASGLRVP
jgi:hypothetical protein